MKKGLNIDSRNLPCQYIQLGPLDLDCGQCLKTYTLAYQTYGTLNEAKDNAVLICHALTGDQFVIEDHPITQKPGWWRSFVGKGKPIDTDRFFVICSNILGGCMGSTGPSTINPSTGKAYGLDFPVITIQDMVRAQRKLIAALNIEKLHSVIGGSMGGMQALAWAALYPNSLTNVIALATSVRHSAQNIAFNEVGRQAVMADPDWRDGFHPRRGLSVARMAAHITYLSENALHHKFGRNLQDRKKLTYGFDADFQVESYLRHQGMSFVDRFDANCYLYITRAMDYFDLSEIKDGNLAEVFKDTSVRFCLIYFSSDWLFPTSEARMIIRALNSAGAEVSFVEIQTDRGHDAFLLDDLELFSVIQRFLSSNKENYHSFPLIRHDQKFIANIVNSSEKILEVGCGSGDLLDYLVQNKSVKASGLELNMNGVKECVEKGLSTVQGDAEIDLQGYYSNSYDTVILSQTLQSMKDPKLVLDHLVRIGKRAIISFHNFGYWRARTNFFLNGSIHFIDKLSLEWWESPSIRVFTINDFERLCLSMGLRIDAKYEFDHNYKIIKNSRFSNFLAKDAIYVLSKQ